MRLQSALPVICSTSRTRAGGCHLQTRAAIRARGRSCCRSGCIGQGLRAKPLQRRKRPVGTTGNQVVGVMVDSGYLVVTLADDSVTRQALPGMGGSEDRTARDAAAAARTTAEQAQAGLEAHEASTHNTDTTARTTAEQAQAGLEAHEASTHNTDAGARTAAAAAAATAATAQTTASTARDAATAAQSDADTAQTTAGQAQVTATAASAAANAARADIDSHEANHPTGMGSRPTVLYEAQTAAIGTSTGLIAGNVICPETGELEFYFEARTGTRQGGVAYARIPTARIRGAESALDVAYSNDSATMLAIPHGANRGLGIAVQTDTNFLMLSAQAPGNFYIRVAHTG